MNEPLQRLVLESNYQKARESIELGIEYARECLIHHDIALGRTTMKNKRHAEMMESDIEKMQQTLKDL